jgi:hypothetical protein
MSYLVDPATLRPFPLQNVVNGSEVIPGFLARVPTSTGAITVLAPDPTGETVAFAVQDVDGSAATNPITIDGNGKLIDGAASLVLSSADEVAILLYDDGEWRRMLPPRTDGDDQPVGYRAREISQWLEPAAASFGDVGPRLSLFSNVAVPGADVTGANTIYFVPYHHGSVVLWNGEQFKQVVISSQLSLALAGLTLNTPYDLCLAISGSTAALEVGSAWGGAALPPARGRDAKGRLVKNGDPTRLVVGGCYATGATTTDDSAEKRFLSNLWNPVQRRLRRQEATGSWTYGVASTWRQARATAANRVEVFSVEFRTVEIEALAFAQAGTSAETVYIGVGVDSTTTNYADLIGGYLNAASQLGVATAKYGEMNEGYHAFNWLEFVNGSGNTTFFGGPERGLNGRVWG